ncbi:hypothetical protein BJ165DRAFT_1562975 [Panaeolus papilionaceus]|nr:hypothetical protein BJ165DRAFT_1562975 [Panaeolus papilionaceus]
MQASANGQTVSSSKCCRPDEHRRAEQEIIYSTPSSPTRVPLLLRKPIQSSVSRPLTSSYTGPPSGTSFSTQPPKGNVWGSKRPPSVKWKVNADVSNPAVPSAPSPDADPRLKSDFETYINSTIRDPQSRVNPPPSHAVLVANGTVPAGPEDEDRLSPISPCFTTPDYGSSDDREGNYKSSSIPVFLNSERSKLLSVLSSQMRSPPRAPKTPERPEPKTVVLDASKEPPTANGGSPLRYYAMLASSEKAAARSGGRVVTRF